jgi:capsular exopolysaccharide synthesis family protein
MELERYLEVLNRRKWVILLTTAVTLAVVVLGTQRMVRTYSAAATVRVAAGHGVAVSYNDLNYADRLMQTYVLLLKSRPLLETVNTRLNLGTPIDELAAGIKVEALANTELIKITVEDREPRRAAAIANTLGGLLVEQGQQLYAGQGKSALEILQEQLAVLEGQLHDDRVLLANPAPVKPDPNAPQDGSPANLAAKIHTEEATYATLLSQYEKARLDEAMQANSVSIAEPALAPAAPSKPNVKLNLALGFLVGLIGGFGLAFIFENLDQAIHSPRDLEAISPLPLLGYIPIFATSKRNQKLGLVFGDGAEEEAASEAFRILSANILAASEQPLRSILVSSAEPGAGKSLVAANLAAALAQTGRRVILIEGDLRHPSLFGLPKAPGLKDAILDPSRLDTTLQPTSIPQLSLLAAGSPTASPSALFYAPTLAKVIQALQERADILLWDSPPILAAADAVVLAPLVDGVMLVAVRDQTNRKQLDQALRELAQVGARTLGVVYNKAQGGSAHYYHSYYRKAAQPAAAAKGSAAAKPDVTSP